MVLPQQERHFDEPRIARHDGFELDAIRAETTRLLELQERHVPHRTHRLEDPIQCEPDAVGRPADERQPPVSGQRILSGRVAQARQPGRTIPDVLLEPFDLCVAAGHPHDDAGGPRRQQVGDLEDLCHRLARIGTTGSLRGQIPGDVQIAIVDHPQFTLADGQQPGCPDAPGGRLVDPGGGRTGHNPNRLVLRQRVAETVEAPGLNQRVGFREPRRHINKRGRLSCHLGPGRATAGGQRERQGHDQSH